MMADGSDIAIFHTRPTAKRWSKGRHRKLSPAAERQVVSYHRAKQPISWITATFGISHQTVYDVLRRNGAAPRPVQRMEVSRERRERLLDLWHDGLSSPAIAKVLGYKTSSSVRTLVQRARERGDPRAVERRDVALTLSEMLKPAADERGMSGMALLEAIVMTIVRDNLYNAVLDD